MQMKKIAAVVRDVIQTIAAIAAIAVATGVLKPEAKPVPPVTTLPDNPTTDDYVAYITGWDTRTYRLAFRLSWPTLWDRSETTGGD